MLLAANNGSTEADLRGNSASDSIGSTTAFSLLHCDVCFQHSPASTRDRLKRRLSDADRALALTTSGAYHYPHRATRGCTSIYQGLIRCSATGTLPGRASEVTSGCGALGTKKPRSCWIGSRTARNGCDYQPQGGRERGLEGMVNLGEPLLSRRDNEQAEEAIRLEPKGAWSGSGCRCVTSCRC